MSKIVLGTVVALLLMTTAYAAMENRAAQRATERYKAAVERAEDEYFSATERATEQYQRELNQALQGAMRGGKVEEAAEIRGVLEGLEAGNLRVTPETISNTTWRWPDGNVSEPWFRLNRDRTVTSGWHNRSGMWSIRDDGSILAIVTFTEPREPIVMELDSDGRSANDGLYVMLARE